MFKGVEILPSYGDRCWGICTPMVYDQSKIDLLMKLLGLLKSFEVEIR